LIHRTALLAMLCFVVACGETPPPDNLASSRSRVAASPEDPQLRLAAARAELDRGDGVAAEILLQQAIDRGLPSEDTLPMLSEALLLQKDPNRVLRTLPSPSTLAPPAASAVALARLEAKAQLSNIPAGDISKDVMALASSADAQTPLLRLANRYPVIASAMQGTSCGTGGALIEWTPAPFAKDRRVLRVGPGETYRTVTEVAKAARDGDVVEIAAGEYTESVLWKANNLLIRGVNGRPHMKAPPKLFMDKAIWVLRGSNTVVENIEFSGARAKAKNGAGIRSQGPGLTVRASYFHDNENGILTGHDPSSTVIVEFSEFARNGYPDGKAHNIYVGRVKRFEMRFSYSHGAIEGHLVKSRAATNLIEYNLLMDEPGSTASYELDLPTASEALVLGNLIVQAATSPNQSVISYAAEKAAAESAPTGTLTVAYNTLYSRRENPIFVNNRSSQPALVANNVFGGARGKETNGEAIQFGNRIAVRSDFVDPDQGNFRLTAGARAIDASESSSQHSITLPVYEPGSGPNGRRRLKVGPLDAGAFEFCTATVALASN